MRIVPCAHFKVPLAQLKPDESTRMQSTQATANKTGNGQQDASSAAWPCALPCNSCNERKTGRPKRHTRS